MDNFEEQLEDDLFGPMPDESQEEKVDEQLGYDDTADYDSDEDDFGADEKTAPATKQDEDFMTTYLRQRGIDRNSVQVANEYGELETKDFDSLSNEDKLAILDSANDVPITDEEINTLNDLRSLKMNLQDFAEWQRQEAVKDYLNQNQQVNYTVNELDDDDLYRYDLSDRYPDMTPEEIEEELQTAKMNDSAFLKKINSIRAEYVQLENQQMQEQIQAEQREKEAQFNDLAGSIVNVARNTNDLHGLTISDEDKEEVLSLLLDKDANGQSDFYKLFSNPEALFKMAWYMKYGDQAFEMINDYYKNVIESSRRQVNTNRTVNRTAKRDKNAPDPFGLNDVFK